MNDIISILFSLHENSFTNDSKDTQAEETVERTQFDQKQLSTVHTELQRHQQSDCKEDDASSDKSIEDESIDFEKNAAFNSLELEDKDEKEGQLSRVESWYLLGLLAWINMLQTSFVLAIQVFSSLPYGLFFYNGATKVSECSNYSFGSNNLLSIYFPNILNL